MIKKFLVAFAAIALLSAGYFIGVRSENEDLKAIAAAHKEHDASEQLEQWRDNVIRASNKGNPDILEWTLLNYANRLSEHIRLSSRENWYAMHKNGLVYNLAMVKANLAYLYSHQKRDKESETLIDEALNLIKETDLKGFNNTDSVWRFARNRLLFNPTKIDWRESACTGDTSSANRIE